MVNFGWLLTVAKRYVNVKFSIGSSNHDSYSSLYTARLNKSHELNILYITQYSIMVIWVYRFAFDMKYVVQ